MHARMMPALAMVLSMHLLGGCTFKQEIRDSAISYNLAQEEAANRQLLLNVLRSVERRPMHFTSFSTIRGNMKRSAGGSASQSFISHPSNNIFSVTPNFSFETSPSFEISVLDSAEFWRGIMKPIDEERFNYYIDMGFRPELLLYLFVREVREKDGTQKYLNYPEDSKKMAAFKDWVEDTVTKGYHLTTTYELVGTLGDAKAVGVDSLVAADKGGFVVTSKSGANALIEGKTTDAANKLRTELGKLPDDPYVVLKRKSGFHRNNDPSANEVIVVRSPQAMIHYLGELTRVRLYGNDIGSKEHPVRLSRIRKSAPTNPTAPSTPATGADTDLATQAAPQPDDPPDDALWPLFVVAESHGQDEPSQVAVEYDGKRYLIPTDPSPRQKLNSGYTMQVLSIISQLVALQKKAEEYPSSRAVTVVGQ